MVLTVPRQDDLRQLAEPVTLPQHVHILGQRLAMPLSAVEEEELLVVPLERDPRCCIRLHPRRADVERHVHRMSGVKVEVLHPTILHHVKVRLAVDSRRIHLPEVHVVLLVEHAVVPEAFAVRLSVTFELLLLAHGGQPLGSHHGVEVVDPPDDLTVLGVVLEGLHQLPQRVLPLATRGGHHHQALVPSCRQDRHEPGDRIFAGEQGELGEGVVLEGGADAVLVLAGLEVALELQSAPVGEPTFHHRVTPHHEITGYVVLEQM